MGATTAAYRLDIYAAEVLTASVLFEGPEPDDVEAIPAVLGTAQRLLAEQGGEDPDRFGEIWYRVDEVSNRAAFYDLIELPEALEQGGSSAETEG